MAQTLSSLAPINIQTTFSANLAAVNNLDNRMIIALAVLAKCYVLNASGGVDYRTNFKQLRIDTAATVERITAFADFDSMFWRMVAQNTWIQAHSLDPTIPSDVNALVKLMGKLVETPQQTLMYMWVFLSYQSASTGA